MLEPLATVTHKYCLFHDVQLYNHHCAFIGNLTQKRALKNLSITTHFKCFHLPDLTQSYKFPFKFRFVENPCLTKELQLMEICMMEIYLRSSVI